MISIVYSVIGICKNIIIKEFNSIESSSFSLFGAVLVHQPFSYFSFNFLDCSITLMSAQSFDGCDYYKELSPGIVYSIVSPNYKNPYAPGTFCRYTGMYFWMHFQVLILNLATF